MQNLPQPPLLSPLSDRAQVLETLHQSPQNFGEFCARWTLALLRRHCPALQHLKSLSGVWRRLDNWKLAFKRTRSHITSPDTAYGAKVGLIEKAQEAAQRGELVLLYADEHTYYRQPLRGLVWHAQGGGGCNQPQHVRSTHSDTKRRTVAGLNSCSGQVVWRGGTKVGVRALVAFLEQVRQTYGPHVRIVIVWDNWPIHYHAKVLEAAAQQRIELLWLPTYAPWLNPIEKLWGYLHKEVLFVHRHAAQWLELRQRVEDFLNRFHQPSPDLLRFVGLWTD